MAITPCKDCTERHFCCHDSCERYLAFKAEVEKRRERSHFATLMFTPQKKKKRRK